MLPQLSNDICVKAAQKMELEYIETFFYRAALEAGWRDQPGRRDAEDEARSLHNIWARQGFHRLPNWVQHYARIRAGEKTFKFGNIPIH